jgi:hypothetical protein
MKILIIGHARHGKDTVAGIIGGLTGMRFESSSMAACRIFIFDMLKHKYAYRNVAECFEDRFNHRSEWYELICWYNRNDRARLAKNILAENDIYVGMRDREEIRECIKQGVFDVVVGVFDPREELEQSDSFNIDVWEESDIVIMNNSTLDDLEKRVKLLVCGMV